MIFVLVIGSLASAQTVQGVVTGTVYDASGAVLAGAAVALTNIGTNITQSETTGSDGLYRFSLVPPGEYRISVKAQGFNEKQVTGIRVDPSQTVSANITLAIATASTSVDVQESSALVQSATSDVAHTINQNLIANIPLLTRNVFDLAFLAPSVTQGMNLNPASGGARESGTATF